MGETVGRVKVINKVNFPKIISFGSIPLCEPATKIIPLKFQYPLPGNVSFTIEVLTPHPYFKIYPLKGELSASGDVNINIAFSPITLGSCMMSIKLFISQKGFVPIESIVSANVVSGMIESNALKKAEANVIKHILATGNDLNDFLGHESSFRGDLSVKNNPNSTVRFDNNTKNGFTNSKLLQLTNAKNHNNDPTAVMLASTFRSTDLSQVLDSAIQGSNLLSSKMPNGILKSTLPARPRGPGSGAVYDAGGQWMTLNQQKKMSVRREKDLNGTISEDIIPKVNEDQVIEMLRIPPNLDSVPAVTFVLTQESGKLKPKDLKVAIERNRAEREIRAEEQKKIREEGGGAGVGVLDLRGILAEERLNMEQEGDPFKRQLREMAFLADIDDVDKLEIEKGFRISEEYLGSNLLESSDISLVLKQREKAKLYKKRSDWRKVQERQLTNSYPPTHNLVKAGAPATIANKMIKTLTPAYDTNRNDVWAKRMNTLRRFITIVGRFIIRKRINDRLAKFKDALRENNVTNNKEGQAWVALENATYKMKGPSKTVNKKDSSGIDGDLVDSSIQPKSVALMVCGTINENYHKRLCNDHLVNSKRISFNENMVRRIMFPKFVAEDGAARLEMEPVSINTLTKFDDRSFFQLKLRPEYLSMGFKEHQIPTVPIHFPACADKERRTGAFEELVIRPPADATLTAKELLDNLPTESETLLILRKQALHFPEIDETDHSGKEVKPLPDVDECNLAAPDWLSGETSWSSDELNFFQSRPELRVYNPVKPLVETSDDWILRPFAQIIKYDEDLSLRTSWMKSPGFLSANTYLFGGHENRSVDPPPPPGPTLVDFYMPDVDRHRSGMNCFARDHYRGLVDNDADIPNLQIKQDIADNLTDSESDDEEGYIAPAPSISLIRKLLHRNTTDESAPSSPLKSGEEAFSPTKSIGVFDPNIFGRLSDNERKDDQVELLRDRKTLEMESTLQRLRYERANEITERLTEISKSSSCLIQSLNLQVPFHVYEDEVYKSSEHLIPPVINSYVENVSMNQSQIFDSIP